MNPLFSSVAFSLRADRVLIKFSRDKLAVGRRWLAGCWQKTAAVEETEKELLSPSKSDSSIQTSKPNRKYKHFKANTESRDQDRPPDERAGKNLTKGLQDTLCTVCVYLHTRIQAAARGGTKKKRSEMPKPAGGGRSALRRRRRIRCAPDWTTTRRLIPRFYRQAVHFIFLLLRLDSSRNHKTGSIDGKHSPICTHKTTNRRTQHSTTFY